MEYVFIAGAQLFGVFFHTMLKIFEIDKRDPNDSAWEVAMVFYKENIWSMILSGGILLFMLFVHLVLDSSGDWTAQIPYFHPVYYFLSLILGYQGQRILYKFLDKGTSFVDKKIDEKLK